MHSSRTGHDIESHQISMDSNELNPEQLKAVRHTDGPLMLVAGAGSGKTRAITFRILHMIRDKGIDPENILAITFTNKAAAEMRERVVKQMGAGGGRVPWISTFHSLCLRLLRQHMDFPGYTKDFVIYDAADQLSVVKKCMKAASINDEAFPPKTILNHISGFKNDYQLPEHINLDALPYGHKLKAAHVYPHYQNALKENNALDFDDLLMMTVKLFQQDKALCDHYNNRFRYILVDEFQDTNLTQYHLIQLLSRAHHNVCVVGDDDQSIYRWRGANLENLLHFEKDFPGTTVIKLEENYRSTQTILNAAGAVVRENMTRREKNLWTRNEAGEPILYYRAEDEIDEARAVCERIHHWVQDGASFNDMAILYRTNAQSRVLEDQLRHLNVPYQVIGGLKFYERKEIKDILSYLRVVMNPSDAVSLKRIVNTPVRGIGKASVDKVEAYCSEQHLPLLEGLRRAANVVGTGPAKKIEQFVLMMDRFQKVMQECSAVDLLKAVFEQTGYLTALQKENTQEAKSRLENLNELYSAVEQFVDIDRKGTLKDFLDTTALVADLDNLDDSRGVLALMTLHTCKGLEFDSVCILGFENGLLPHASSLSSSEEYEEERRLCYVGFTRARKKLMISNARRRRIYGSTFTYQPSDFLSAIPREAMTMESSALTSAPSRSPYGQADAQDNWSLPAGSAPSPASGNGFSVGTKVLHSKFGSGVVVNREGGEDDLKVVVFFKGVGKKKLAVAHANLIVV
ncbi:ATP-dependent helicase [Nitrospina watsonii]|uniref:DNA 3'-5' helicase n=1 Tax=Nitrospina watsonii TaxID=1323948 RepID=A0ABN8W3F0_9BACT|nr:UvrD-helicase domain-containing protein [Nitrospina watsonii]CAI2719394.1 ATP-dependent DNA helicase PcrA [Nitrospina watsonii]